ILGDLNEWWRPLRSLVALYGFGGDHVRSFPTQWPILALDHVLVRPARAVEKTHAHDSPLARVASDHLPVRAVVAPQRCDRRNQTMITAPGTPNSQAKRYLILISSAGSLT